MAQSHFLPILQGITLLMLVTFFNSAWAGQAILSWAPNTETDLAGYKIYYGTTPGLYTQVLDVGLTSTPDTPVYTMTNLSEGTTYYFAVAAYDSSGNASEFSIEVSKTITDTTGAPDTLPPMDVIDFSVEPGDGQVKLTWTNPPDSDFMGVRIRFRMDGSFPANAQDGKLVGDFTGSPLASNSHVHAGLHNGSTYYYAAFAYDANGNYSQTVYASATPFSSQSADQSNFNDIKEGLGCGTVKNTAPPKNPPAWPLDLLLLGTLLLWLSFKNTQRRRCPAKRRTME
jgi:chitodextrinase